MYKILILITLILIGQATFADLLNGNYVSPEHYAVNEADMQYIDYSSIPPAPKLDLDRLDEMRFPVQNQQSVETTQPEQVTEEHPAINNSEKKHKKAKKEEDINDEAFKKRLSYKIAKWWVDQRYKREEAHHGDLHEIKVQKRIENEKKLEELAKQNQQK